jgi:carboxyl-terminal processing protease
MLYAIADLTDPAGRRVEGVGVVPDERLPLSRGALLAGRDDVMAAALRWLNGQRARPAPEP